MSQGVFVFVVLMLVIMTNPSDGVSWCVCRSDVGDSSLQKSLDYACGAGADCGPIHQGGVCFQPDTVRAHCSYAVNSYYQNKGQAEGTCIFTNTAIITQTDPSTGGTCVYPSTASLAGNGTTPPSTTVSAPGPAGSSSSNGVRVFLRKTESLFVIFVTLLLVFISF